MGKFQVCLIIKELVELDNSIEELSIADYLEVCKDWEDAKKTIEFFKNRIEGKLNGG